MTAQTLPAVNATLNGMAFILLVVGYVLIRKRRLRAHGMTMLGATICSALFLVGYVTHKVILRNTDIRLDERFPGLPEGWRFFYLYIVLYPHLILAVVMLPFIGKGLWHAYRRDFRKHKFTNRWTIWIWLYVSLTGVLIYYLLYHFFPALTGRPTAA